MQAPPRSRGGEKKSPMAAVSRSIIWIDPGNAAMGDLRASARPQTRGCTPPKCAPSTPSARPPRPLFPPTPQPSPRHALQRGARSPTEPPDTMWWGGATRSPAQGGGGEDRRQPQHIAGLSLSRATNDPASWRTAGFETGTHRSYLNLICSFVITGL
eukprot:COSAG02_NODE_1637_length_11547_cov_10.509085_3_plen_157_part_00